MVNHLAQLADRSPLIRGADISATMRIPRHEIEARLSIKGITPKSVCGNEPYYDSSDAEQIEEALVDAATEEVPLEHRWSDTHLADAAGMAVDEVATILSGAGVVPLFCLDGQRIYPQEAVSVLRRHITLDIEAEG